MGNLKTRMIATAMIVLLSGIPQLANAAAVKVAEGTPVTIRFDEKLSSASNTQGDQFGISLNDKIVLVDGGEIQAGYRGRGEVTAAAKKGYMGKAGTLNVRVNYIRIGDTKVYLRANKSQDGKDALGSTIALTVLFGPLGLLKRGHDVDINSGQEIVAYVDRDAEIDPSTPPPLSAN
jgi:hypothetical protein